jgi:D-3-phosphoglycerate dehydrogenase
MLGIVGCGNIGKMTAKKAGCFGLKVLGYDPYIKQSHVNAYSITLVSLEKLLAESDYVSLHTPLTAETRHMISGPQFKQMKPTAYLINTSRGPVVDEPALIKALQEKRIAGAGLDVFEREPIAADNPLLKMDNVIVIPHTASTSDAAFERQPVNPAREAVRVLSGKWPKYPVNPEVKPRVKLSRE